MRTAQGLENLDVFVPRYGGFGLRHSHRSKQETESRAQGSGEERLWQQG